MPMVLRRRVARSRPGCGWRCSLGRSVCDVRQPARLKRRSLVPPHTPGTLVGAADLGPGESGSSRWPVARGWPRPLSACLEAAGHERLL